MLAAGQALEINRWSLVSQLTDTITRRILRWYLLFYLLHRIE